MRRTRSSRARHRYAKFALTRRRRFRPAGDRSGAARATVRRGLRAAFARLRAAPLAERRRVRARLSRPFAAPRRARRCSSTTATANWSKSANRTQAGADLVMGSLIKNLGGSLAPGGRLRCRPGRSDRARRRTPLRARAGRGARAVARLRAARSCRAFSRAADRRAVPARAGLRGRAVRGTRLRGRSRCQASGAPISCRRFASDRPIC